MTKTKKIIFLSCALFILVVALVLVISFTSSNENKKYNITDVVNAKEVVIKKDEKLLTFTVENEVSTFDTSNIKVSSGKAVVYTDKECTKQVDSLELSEGINTFYFKIRLNKGNKLLKKTVWKLIITREIDELPIPPIEKTELNKEKYRSKLASMAAVFETGTTEGEKYEEALVSILEKEKNIEIFDYIIDGMEQAGLSDEKASAVIDLVKQNLVGRDTELDLENLIEGISDIANRILLIAKDIDKIITPTELAIIVYTYYVGSTTDKASIDEMLESLKDSVDQADYEKLVGTLNDISSTLMTKEEFVYVFKSLFSVVKTIADMSENELTAFSEIINLVLGAEDISEIDIKESDIENINKIGNVILRIGKVLSKEKVNRILEILVKFVQFDEDDYTEIRKVNYINLIGYIPTILKFVGNMTSSLTFDNFNAIKVVITNILADMPEDTKPEEFGKNLVDACSFIGSTYNELTENEQSEVKEVIENIINIKGSSTGINIETIFDQILKISKLSGTINYEKVTTDFIEVLTKPVETSLNISVKGSLIIEQDSSIDALLTLLNDRLEILYLKYNSDTESYDSTKIVLKAENLVRYELKIAGLQKITIKVEDQTKDILYYVSEKNPKYVLSPDNSVQLSGVFVYDLEGNLYINRYANQSLEFRLINKNTGGMRKIDVLVEDIKIIKPDYSTAGAKNGIARFTSIYGEQYYIIVEYVVVDTNAHEVTEMEVTTINKVFQNVDAEITGSIKVTFNNGITLMNENKWSYDNYIYVNFSKSNITGLDITKEGKQIVTITVDEYTMSYEIDVISEARGKNIDNVSIYADDSYYGYPSYEDLIRVYVSFINSDKYYYSGSYKQLKTYFEEKGLSYEIELSFGELKAGENDCTLTLVNKETNQKTISKFTLTLIDQNEYNKVTKLVVSVKDNFFVGYTVDEIFKKIQNIEYGNDYYTEYLYGDKAYNWMLKNAKCEIKETEGKVIFSSADATYEVDGVFFVTKDMVGIDYKIDADFIPSVFKNFSEDQLLRFIVSTVSVENANIGFNEENYFYDVFNRIGSIEKTTTSVNIKIGEEIIRTYAYEDIDSTVFEMYLSYNDTLYVQKGVDQTDYILSMISSFNISYQKDGWYYNATTYNIDTLASLAKNGIITITTNASEDEVILTFKIGDVTLTNTNTDVVFYEESEVKNIALLESVYTTYVLQRGAEETLDKALEYTSLFVRYFDGTEETLFGEEIKALITAGKITAALEGQYIKFTYSINSKNYFITVYVCFCNLDDSDISGENSSLYFDFNEYDENDPYQAISSASILLTIDGSYQTISISKEAAIKFAKEYCNISYTIKDGSIEYTYTINDSKKSEIFKIE